MERFQLFKQLSLTIEFFWQQYCWIQRNKKHRKLKCYYHILQNLIDTYCFVFCHLSDHKPNSPKVNQIKSVKLKK